MTSHFGSGNITNFNNPTTTIIDNSNSYHQHQRNRLQSSAAVSNERTTTISNSSNFQQQHQQLQNLNSNESLEYFIKFPTPNFRNEINSAESDYVFVYNETNVPIIMLLGWAGCQDRYLMKYSKIYEDRG